MPENTNHRQNVCPAWIWLVLLIGLVLLYLLYQQASTKKAEWIQGDIQSRVIQNLGSNSGFSQIAASTDGRDVTLNGEVQNQDFLEKAVQIARQTNGTRLVINNLKVATTATSTVVEPVEPPTSPEKPELSTSAPILQAKVEAMPDEFAPLDEELIEIEQAEITQEKFKQLDFSNITFEKNSSALTTIAKSTLDKASSALLENPTVKIRIEGHTDTSGNPELNLRLSKQRAQSVLKYLVDSNIDNSRLEADGYGDQFPIAPNDTKAGRIKNRRIEIKVKNGE